jgi:ubiquinone/menaquinone biosynthesis C-methylase UbiE
VESIEMNRDINWGYEEKSLSQRIDVHQKYAKYEINDWILEILNLKLGERVLDVGCGNGKQILTYVKKVSLSLAVGTDLSTELLQEARMKAAEEKATISFIKHDANLSFQFDDNSFDVISCCFTIYYFLDIQKFLMEMKRILRRGGRIFIAGPTVENAKEMIVLHSKITGREVLQSREKRMRDEIIPSVKREFSPVKIDIFNNPVTFPNSQSFIDYYASTLLFEESFRNPEERAVYLRKMKEQADKIVKKFGTFELNKQVYGILGHK